MSSEVNDPNNHEYDPENPSLLTRTVRGAFAWLLAGSIPNEIDLDNVRALMVNRSSDTAIGHMAALGSGDEFLQQDAPAHQLRR